MRDGRRFVAAGDETVRKILDQLEPGALQMASFIEGEGRMRGAAADAYAHVEVRMASQQLATQVSGVHAQRIAARMSPNNQ